MKVRDILMVRPQTEEISPINVPLLRPVAPQEPAKPTLRVLPGGLERAEQRSEPSSWLCRHCGWPAEIEDVEPRESDGVLMTYWRCEPCGVWAVMPATVKEPPVWVSRREQ